MKIQLEAYKDETKNYQNQCLYVGDAKVRTSQVNI